MVLEDHGCKGEVAVYSQAGRMFVSSEGWTQMEGERLCNDLQCGLFKSKREVSGTDSFWNKTFKCPTDGKPEGIWNCETQTPPSLQKKKLFIECQDRSKVNLSDGCSGQLTIDSSPVCNKNWDINYSNRVCQELNCGNAFDNSDSKSTKDGLHVSCDQHHHILGQCRRTQGTCSSSVSIFCYKNITFRTREKCGGSLQVNSGKQWESVCIGTDTMADNLMNSLCKEIGCEAKGTVKRTSKDFSGGKKLNCPADYRDVKYCVSKDTCQNDQQAFIWCKGYTPKEPDPTPTPPPPTSTILIGLGVSLVVLILIIVFIRNRILRRNRKSRVFPQMFPGREEDLDSEMYEDIHKSDEMEEDFRQESESLFY
ncbi:scavenger receptor cysteine-rich type 1 protein M130 [Oryzias melastigma]|uniref:scavenger receptor cysteine-rich type 1 protein M130 n=1 Tax=Oryzias melastigma TaxID=30732 RepID=UPI00168D5088|nr:scavenger receptor cysteine-rich type 1 protein M130 [Oryzias melastigma]